MGFEFRGHIRSASGDGLRCQRGQNKDVRSLREVKCGRNGMMWEAGGFVVTDT